ncbi:MAG TPA: hypothetical protein VHB21_03140 [Minicystis sp.]|nr:hypothetical protein [Minicystis sp.]
MAPIDVEIAALLALALAAAIAFARSVARARRVETRDARIVCPKTGAAVRCRLHVLPGGECVDVTRCSGDNPECTRSCIRLLNAGAPIELDDAQNLRPRDDSAPTYPGEEAP